ncbi:phytochelatin synthase family protein [Rubellimicrobium sp. CFH 75288]|uniref:phytochelatin synthase family protein n=1 Tax=Rubellimicrobium sp. CFH 75288 TaxID=2697034 RepID=UPI001AA15742|nr:phytochelatin synthase family protein [Rubellimicrobium sp. CFH 75288]
MLRSTVVLMALAAPVWAEQPKLGPNAVAITDDHAFLRQAPAPDFWAFAPFVKPQVTPTACTVAALAAAVNGLRGLPASAEEPVLTQQALLEAVGDPEWIAMTAPDGTGVPFDALARFAAASLRAAGLARYEAEAVRLSGPDDLDRLRTILRTNEASADDAVVVAYNQGVVTGDWFGGHVALIGAYDGEADRVLILEVDQEWYIPYWTPVAVLAQAIVTPVADPDSPFPGEVGGLIHLRPQD